MTDENKDTTPAEPVEVAPDGVKASEPVEEPRDAMTGYLQAGLYRVGLYQVRLELLRDGRPMAETSMRRVGYVQVRQPAVL